MNRWQDIPDHPDVFSAIQRGYATFQSEENSDTPENRAAFIDEHAGDLVKWLRLGYPDILDEFIDFSAQVCPVGYQKWLN